MSFARPSAPALLRVAGAADHPLVVALLCELIDALGPGPAGQAIKARCGPDLASALVCPAVRIFLAEVDGQVAGLGRADVLGADPLFRLQAETRGGYIDQMFVRPDYRRRGIGRQLLAACEAWLRSLGLRHCLLHAAEGAGPFYDRAGYGRTRQMIRRL